MKKLITIALTLVMLVCVLAGCGCEHEWTEADCNDPKTCSLCGETEGDDLGHDYADADCEHGKICSRCGKEKGDPLGHSWISADCVNPETCENCGATQGEALGHDLNDATCTEAAVCSVCGESVGEPNGHSWLDADCVNPKTCSVCDETEGEALGHSWLDATYEAPKTCTVCGETEGEPLQPEAPANLGLGHTDYADQMNTVLNILGYNLVYLTTGDDGAIIYVVTDGEGNMLQVYVGFYLDSDGSNVYGVVCTTDQTDSQELSTITGNCFGAAWAVADPTYSQEDLAALTGNYTVQEDGSIYYHYVKNGLLFEMKVTTDLLTTAISPAD